jgi:hypothetical protein
VLSERQAERDVGGGDCDAEGNRAATAAGTGVVLPESVWGLGSEGYSHDLYRGDASEGEMRSDEDNGGSEGEYDDYDFEGDDRSGLMQGQEAAVPEFMPGAVPGLRLRPSASLPPRSLNHLLPSR